MYTSKEEERFPDKPSCKELEGIRGTFVLSGLALLTSFSNSRSNFKCFITYSDG
jgi:hypothetical protein